MEKIILQREMEEAEAERKDILKARNKAASLLEDARARYVKEKTRARSKKAAMEKDAALHSKRFDVLENFEKFEDIQEAYGCDCFGEDERDRLEALWEEREAIKNKMEDGIYTDDVTKALHAAWIFLQDYMEEEVERLEAVKITFDRQRKEADEEAAAWNERQNNEYNKLKGQGVL